MLLLGMTLLFFSSILEIIIWHRLLQSIRHVIVFIISSLVLLSIFILLFAQLSLPLILIEFLAIYRLVNLARIIKNRRPFKYLAHNCRQSSLYLYIGQLILVLLIVFKITNLDYSVIFTLAIIQLFFITSIIIRLMAINKKILIKKPIDKITNSELPSLSILIPARNETFDLEECLKSLLNNDYPKLEILVIDDCSSDARTPGIIRSFAHDGVRFISGNNPPPNWLAKNYAYERLVEESNGQYLLFCGVDTRFSLESLSMLMSDLINQNLQMLSVIPKNNQPNISIKGLRLLNQSLRYAWELIIPQSLKNRPPVLSTCWIIDKEMLVSIGSFKSVKHSILPERYFATKCAENNRYSLIESNDQFIGLTSNKNPDEQFATNIRLRYPTLHQRLELISIYTLGEILFFIFPFFLIIKSIFFNNTSLILLTSINGLLLIIIYIYIVGLTYHKFIWRSLFYFPIAILYDIYLMNYSMYKYEFKQVIWKERNICTPLMHLYSPLDLKTK